MKKLIVALIMSLAILYYWEVIAFCLIEAGFFLFEAGCFILQWVLSMILWVLEMP
jgi:hypothetical protein